MDQGTVIEIAIRTTWGGSIPCYNINRWLIDTPGGVNDTDCTSDMQSLYNLLLGQLDDFTHTSLTFQDGLLNEVSPNHRAIGTLTHSTYGGGRGGTLLPVGVSFHACQRTGTKRRLSNKWVAGGSTSDCTAGKWISSAVANFDDFMELLSVTYGPGSHIYRPGVWSATYNTFHEYTSWSCDQQIAYLTRRRPHV